MLKLFCIVLYKIYKKYGIYFESNCGKCGHCFPILSTNTRGKYGAWVEYFRHFDNYKHLCKVGTQNYAPLK